MSLVKIERALISVSDKKDLVPLCKVLDRFGVEMISTGGTFKAIDEARIPVIPIEDFTDSPEVMGGRVKTLHPRVHGGLLFRRDNEQHVADLVTLGGKPIDLVIGNLYPFEETAANPDAKIKDVIEQIDIGGPSMLRSAAKNYEFVTVVTTPFDYQKLIDLLEGNDGCTTLEFRELCASKVFSLSLNYDRAIAYYFAQSIVHRKKV